MFRLFGKKASRKRLEHILEGCEPPCFPATTTQLLALLRDPDTPVGDLSSSLQRDPGLVVRVLRLVNSAAFGLRRPVEDIGHAATILGRAQLEHLVLGVAVKSNLPSAPAPGFDASRFWYASFLRATLAKDLASKLHPADAPRSFAGGLLQDMAIPLLAHARTKEYGPLLEAWHAGDAPHLHELEREALGWSHDEVGGYLAAEWELPESLASLIQGHHDSLELLPALRLVALLGETSSEHGDEALVERARTDFGLEPDRTRVSLESAQTSARELAQAL